MKPNGNATAFVVLLPHTDPRQHSCRRKIKQVDLSTRGGNGIPVDPADMPDIEPPGEAGLTMSTPIAEASRLAFLKTIFATLL